MTQTSSNEDIESLCGIQSVRYDFPTISDEPEFIKHTENKLHIENGIIYTFRDEINAFEVEEYIKDHIYQYRIGTRFIVFSGFHTSDDGQLAGTDLNLVDQYQAMFDRLNEDCCSYIVERQYKMGKIIPLCTEKAIVIIIY